MDTAPIAVTGANGPLVEALAARHVPVRAAVHGDHEAFDATVETVRFDYESPESWERAFDGAAGLFVLRPPHISRVADSINPAINDAVDRGVRHVVTLSVKGAGNNPLSPHRRIEKHVESLDVAWTHIRPGFYMQNLTGVHDVGIRRHDEIIVPAGDGAANWIDTRDIGELAAVVLAEGENHAGRVYEPTGPDALDYHRVAEILSDVLDRRIAYERPGVWRYIQHMRRETDFELGFILVSCLLHTVVRLGRSADVTDDIERATGRSPRTLRTFAKDHAHHWRRATE